MVQKSDAQQEETGTTQVEQPQLSIADLQVLAKIIELATSRGAFRAAELSQIGMSFDKLAKFLTFVEQSQKEAKPAESKE